MKWACFQFGHFNLDTIQNIRTTDNTTKSGGRVGAGAPYRKQNKGREGSTQESRKIQVWRLTRHINSKPEKLFTLTETQFYPHWSTGNNNTYLEVAMATRDNMKSPYTWPFSKWQLPWLTGKLVLGDVNRWYHKWRWVRLSEGRRDKLGREGWGGGIGEKVKSWRNGDVRRAVGDPQNWSHSLCKQDKMPQLPEQVGHSPGPGQFPTWRDEWTCGLPSLAILFITRASWCLAAHLVYAHTMLDNLAQRVKALVETIFTYSNSNNKKNREGV